MRIVWTNLAYITYYEVLKGLENRWTLKEIRTFIKTTDDLLNQIKHEQIVFPIINKKLNLHKVVIHKNVSLFYKQDEKEKIIYLVTFFHNRMNPNTLAELLSS